MACASLPIIRLLSMLSAVSVQGSLAPTPPAKLYLINPSPVYCPAGEALTENECKALNGKTLGDRRVTYFGAGNWGNPESCGCYFNQGSGDKVYYNRCLGSKRTRADSGEVLICGSQTFAVYVEHKGACFNKYWGAGDFWRMSGEDLPDGCQQRCNDEPQCFGITFTDTKCYLASTKDTPKLQKLCSFTSYTKVTGYTRTPKGCVSGHNIKKWPSQTIPGCKQKCEEDDRCVAFEYSTDQNSGDPGDCILQDSSNADGCDGGLHNLDLYVRQGCPNKFFFSGKHYVASGIVWTASYILTDTVWNKRSVYKQATRNAYVYFDHARPRWNGMDGIWSLDVDYRTSRGYMKSDDFVGVRCPSDVTNWDYTDGKGWIYDANIAAGPALACIRSDPSRTGPSCLNSGTVTGITGSCGCSCAIGYTGTYCQTAMPCTAAADGGPCQNSGTVTGTTGNCGCTCTPGYTGANCQTTTYCTAAQNGKPCQNGGIVTGRGSYCSCSCPTHNGDAMYDGDNCETALPCTPATSGNPCQNGGTVTGNIGSCGCNCPDGYNGSYCQTISPCTAAADGDPCQNSGTVTGMGGNCGCNCPDGYSGSNCQELSACTAAADGNPCQNSGTVTGMGGQCGCNCPDLSTGANCQTTCPPTKFSTDQQCTLAGLTGMGALSAETLCDCAHRVRANASYDQKQFLWGGPGKCYGMQKHPAEACRWEYTGVATYIFQAAMSGTSGYTCFADSECNSGLFCATECFDGDGCLPSDTKVCQDCKECHQDSDALSGSCSACSGGGGLSIVLWTIVGLVVVGAPLGYCLVRRRQQKAAGSLTQPLTGPTAAPPPPAPAVAPLPPAVAPPPPAPKPPARPPNPNLPPYTPPPKGDTMSLPTTWANVDLSQRFDARVDINRTTRLAIERLVNETFIGENSKKTSQVLVIRIDRIEDSRLWVRYQYARRKIKKDRGNSIEKIESMKRGWMLPSGKVQTDVGDVVSVLEPNRESPTKQIDPELNEFYLWHGGVDHHGAAAYDGNYLKFPRSSLYKGGFAVDLAECSSKADENAPEGTGVRAGTHVMILCRAICGQTYRVQGDRAQVDDDQCFQAQKQGYDSLLIDPGKRGYREFVPLDEAQVYPEFAVFYQRL